ncbi:vacuolar morphogenesis protein AvaB [Pochonia chlamydosporia 170]|uniref:Vacuolar morphogenesis protein AvaB n=1 Tax=Pochonia chlamydosporia 170 TaxID=1380566 RepID=A0A179FZN0_METCM|nr:vacuolar morphogenesis protein AvaB [Pochonia chlamydosporia 170]OAQ71114.1 vacuolar morphogenesis protein AvaB [Pochonia chlamydosporia 170]
MLSAFTARPIIELRQRDKSKIETILAYGDRILVGLNSGALRVYRLNDLSSQQQGESTPAVDPGAPDTNSPQNGDNLAPRPSGKPTDLLREVEKFSTRAIDQLAIIKEANIIVSLSNYYISLYDLQNYDHIETLSRTKNASCFAVTSNIVKDQDTGIPEIISRLAVAVKRRLLLWNWHESELSEEVAEVVLAESIRSITWANATKVVCGMNSGYVVVDVLTREVVEVVSPGAVGANGQGSRFGAVSTAGMGYVGLGGYTPKPLAAKLADGQMLLAKDINTMFIDDSGKPLEKRQIPWPLAPESIGYSYPYILALQPPAKGSLEVRNPDTLSLMQTISLPGAAQLHFPPPTVSLAHAGKGFHISSDRCVWKMGATDYDSQVEELIQNANFDEAISILNMLEDALLKNKVETLREVKMLKAEMLFKKKKFRQAMDLMNEDDVHAPPERVLRLYPPKISGSLSQWAETRHEDATSGHGAMTTNGERPSSRDAATTTVSTANVGGFAKLFLGGHKKTASDTASVLSKKDGVDVEDTQTAKDAESAEDKPLDSKDLKNAVLELNSYLAGTRARLQRYIDPVTGKLKDQEDKQRPIEEAAERFLRTTQTESEQKLEEQLRNTFRLVDTTLFRAYMFSQPSLAGSLFRIPNFCDPDVVNEALLEHNRYTELIDFFYGKRLHVKALSLLHRFGSPVKPDEAAPSLHGPDRTIEYLKNLPPSEIDLIIEHAGWALKSNPTYAMEIFTGDTENAETLPRDRVVSFLHSVDPQLERQYLEHIINELDDMTHDFHNRLVELYVDTLRHMNKNWAWDEIMSNFVTFLRDSRQVYSLTKALGMIPKDDPSFYEAQAVILSNMGQHRKALEIYVFQMRDYAKAEEYCNRVHKSQDMAVGPSMNSMENASIDTDDGTQSIYHILLSLYLKPPPLHEVQLKPALDLLSKHGSRLPATSTLSLIPDDLPVNSLEAYFRGRMRSANSLVNESRIVAGLRKAEQIAIAARLNIGDSEINGQGGRNRHVTITDERHCFVCHKKLGGGMRIGGSVVAVLPDNTVVHYGCLNRALGQKADNSRPTNRGRDMPFA